MAASKKLAILSLAIVACGAAYSQHVGRVLSSQPILQQVAIPRQVCSTQQMEVYQNKSGAGAVMGALAGGATGNAVGRGAGNAAATMIGVFGGAILGDRIEGAPPSRVENIQRCSNQNFFENRTVGYNVVYEFAGRQYSVQMPNDPGPTIQVQVSPLGAQSSTPYAGNVVSSQQPYPQQPTVIESRTVYQPYYSPVGVNLEFGYWGGGHHHWH